MAKEGLSDKYEHTSKLLLNNFGVIVFKKFILVLGGPLATVGLSANFGVLVFKASLLYYLGGPSAKVYLSAKFCVQVFKASMLY